MIHYKTYSLFVVAGGNVLIPYSRQSISEEDIDSVSRALRADFLTQGPTVPKFETNVCRLVGADFAVAVNSATSALHLACMALEVGPGDLVLTSSISFVASANAAKYCGADIDFVDVNPATANMCPFALEEKLKKLKLTQQRLPKVVIPVHMAGQPCDMEKIFALGQEFGFSIIEDASHALGSSYLGQPTGSCQFSDITVFSFHPVKMITTGEGGMCTTNNGKLASKLQRLRSHGITRSPGEMTHRKETDGEWYYEQIDLGFNYRLTDFQAALGISQAERLEAFVAERNSIARQYLSLISNLPISHLHQAPNRTSSYHLFIVRTGDVSGLERKRLFESLRSHGIMVNVHYIPIYRQPYYERLKIYNPQEFEGAEQFYATCLSLPIYPGLTLEDQKFIIEKLGQPISHQTIF
jgi:UDP-4-amino-4,6-dideoxy-N-acetyl-beta-L-altrosamine transaminase